MINLHQLEIFYHVARCGGVTQAARNMPYGVQQPALSKQIRELEQYFGRPLFHRRPFGLTPTGEKLYEFVKPFFEEMPRVTEELRLGAPELVRLATSPIVLREYLPPILRSLSRGFPRLRLTLREGMPEHIHQCLDAQEIDLAVVIGKAPRLAGCSSVTLVRLPLALLVPARSRLRSARELWQRDLIEEDLICPGEGDVMTRLFRRGLARHEVEWTTSMELGSFDAIEAYAADGFGLGLSVMLPGRKRPRGLRALPLPDFPPLEVSMMWRRKPNPATTMVMAELQKRARALSARLEKEH